MKLVYLLVFAIMLSSCATAKKSRNELTNAESKRQSAITKSIWGALTVGAVVFVVSRVDD